MMYFDNNISIQKQTKSFVYVQYPNNSHVNNNNNNNNNNSYQYDHLRPQQKSFQINVPSSNLSFENQIPVLETTNQERLQQSQPKQPEEQPKKKKRQHIGYACDKCRERRVGCDRGKPICGQCKGRHHCQYSNHALRLDNVSMRQRLDELENQVSWLTSFAKNLEQDYRATVPRSQTQAYPHSCVVQKPMMDASDELTVACRQETDGPSVYDWAIETGWPVIENADGMKSIFTKITSFEDLNKALRTAVEAIYNTKGNPLYYQPSAKQFDLPSPINQTIPNKRLSITGNETDSGKEHTFTLFESLNRYTTAASGTKNSVDGMGNNFDNHYLETDVMARLIYQHHQCGFPILVSPSRFENHYRQGQLKSLVLSSVFSHAVPHACIYHPHLAQIQQFRELGNRFYNHSHDLLGIDEPANLSNIHQRTLLITYDLDLGRVRRAFLHIGIAIRMCFMLNLHRPEGYVSCKSAFEREQSKRVFWTVWFFDSMVSHLFHDQFSAIKLNQISIELPTPLPEFNQLEMDQTNFAIHLIQVRKIAAILSEESRKLKPRPLVKRLKEKLKRFYRTLPETERFGQINQITFSPGTSVWIRRSYFCVLLDYCQCWITMYRGLLPSANHLGDKPLTEDEQEAILHTSQAAIAIVQLFQAWFRCSEQSGDGFDCFFRPYLYHFMSAKNIFTSNVSQFGRSSPLVNTSRAYLVLLLRLYQTTPTRRSFDESQLEKSFVHFMTTYQIGENEVAYQDIINEALMDEPNADSGWSIFSLHSDPIAKEKLEKDDYLTAPPIPDGVASKCSSNSSIMSEPCTTSDVNFDYF